MSDLRWTDDLSPDGAETESALEELEQDLYHVIEQTEGSNLDDPERGLGVANMLSAPLDPNLASKAENAVQDDDRVARAVASVSLAAQGVTGTGTLDLTIVPKEDVLQELDLQIPIGTSAEPAA